MCLHLTIRGKRIYMYIRIYTKTSRCLGFSCWWLLAAAHHIIVPSPLLCKCANVFLHVCVCMCANIFAWICGHFYHLLPSQLLSVEFNSRLQFFAFVAFALLHCTTGLLLISFFNLLARIAYFFLLYFVESYCFCCDFRVAIVFSSVCGAVRWQGGCSLLSLHIKWNPSVGHKTEIQVQKQQKCVQHIVGNKNKWT